MMVASHSSDPFEKLHAQCVSLARRFSPEHAEEWLDSAQPFLRHTADAIRAISTSSIPSIAEPALQFAMSTPDSAETRPTDADAFAFVRWPHQPHARFTLMEAARAVRKGEVSPVELVKGSLSRIEATEGMVFAWDTVAGEEAITQAKQAERALRNGEDLGPLHGIPVGVKDNIYTEGIPTRGGSRLYETFIPADDANVVTSLKQAGAIVLGKTTTAEMALGDPPATRNPWNLAHTPGGSSSGSAAAVAAGHVPFAVGTQTGGSLNRPAGYTGLVALKPTYGRIDRHGILPVSWTMDHVGFMTTTAVDQAIILESLGCLPPRTRPVLSCESSSLALQSAPIQGMTVGRPDRYFFDTLHAAQQAAYNELLRVLENDLGVTVKEIGLPPLFEAAVAAHTIIMQCEAAAANADALRENGHLIGPALRSRLLCGMATGAAEYLRAQQVRNMYLHQLRSLFHIEGIDVLATPTSPTPAPKGIHWTGSSIFNSPFSISGFPTIVFPIGIEEESGLPLSAQIVAPPWREGTLLRLAMSYQSITDWHTRRPWIAEG